MRQTRPTGQSQSKDSSQQRAVDLRESLIKNFKRFDRTITTSQPGSSSKQQPTPGLPDPSSPINLRMRLQALRNFPFKRPVPKKKSSKQHAPAARVIPGQPLHPSTYAPVPPPASLRLSTAPSAVLQTEGIIRSPGVKDPPGQNRHMTDRGDCPLLLVDCNESGWIQRMVGGQRKGHSGIELLT